MSSLRLQLKKGPGYLERKFQGTNGPGNEWSTEGKVCRVYSFLGAKVPGNEWSKERMVPRTKVPSWERMFQGTNLNNNCEVVERCTRLSYLTAND